MGGGKYGHCCVSLCFPLLGFAVLCCVLLCFVMHAAVVVLCFTLVGFAVMLCYALLGFAIMLHVSGAGRPDNL